MGRQSKQTQVEAEHGKPIKDILTDLYKEGTIRSVADQLGLNNATVLHWLKAEGIQRHSPHTTDKAMPAGSSQLKGIIDDFVMAKTVEGKTKDTIKFYQSNLYRFLWWLEHEGLQLTLRALDTGNIRHFLYYIQTEPVRFGGLSTASRHQAGQATVDAYWRSLQSLSKWLVREGVIKETDNPIKRVERPKQPNVVIPDIPKQDLIAIFHDLSTGEFRDIRNKAFLLILLDTGVRLRECLGLTIDKLNLNEGILRVFGKGQKERLVHISDLTKGALKAYIDCRPNGDGALWLTESGQALTKSAINSLFRHLRLKYPHIAKLSPHVFRHTFSIDYLRAGGDPFTLQQLGGWTDLDMPRRYAAALTQEDAMKVHGKASPAEFILGKDGQNEKAEIGQ
jgi:integrase/recombinase XerD